jgi:hypothetical protein
MSLPLLGVVVLLLLTSTACAPRWHLHRVPPCVDGLPAQILTDPRCAPDGICGYSCLPDRWAKAITEP